MGKLAYMWVDRREPPNIQRMLMERFSAKLVDLGDNSGDIQIGMDSGHLIWIERSTPSDLLGKLFDREQPNRLWDQLRGIGDGNHIAILAVDGWLNYNQDNQLIQYRGRDPVYGPHFNVLRGVFRKAYQLGVHAEEVREPFPDYLDSLIAWAGKLDQIPVQRNGRYEAPAGVDKAAYNFFANLPGVGPEKAYAMMVWRPGLSIMEYMDLITEPFPNGDKPTGWAETGRKNVEQYLIKRPMMEWKEEEL